MSMNNLSNEGILPANINAFTPAPSGDALSIVGLVKRSGKITGYQLSDGSRVTRDQGVNLARQNRLSGVAVAANQGTEYLRGLPDGAATNNLSNLPSVTE